MNAFLISANQNDCLDSQGTFEDPNRVKKSPYGLVFDFNI